MSKIEQVVDLWKKSNKTIVLTGAGVSTASGLPDFRSKTGLWKQRPEALATLTALEKTPNEFYYFYQWRIAKLWETQPNKAHIMLKNMEDKKLLDLIITQNVDGFHDRAGSKNIAKLHGTLHTVSCLNCGTKYDSNEMVQKDFDWENSNQDNFHYGDECFCKKCEGKLRPDVVLFGEQLPQDAWKNSLKNAQDANLIIVVGSSLLVGPANLLPKYTVDNGGKLVIINYDKTHLDNIAEVVINDDIEKTLLEIETFF